MHPAREPDRPALSVFDQVTYAYSCIGRPFFIGPVRFVHLQATHEVGGYWERMLGRWVDVKPWPDERPSDELQAITRDVLGASQADRWWFPAPEGHRIAQHRLNWMRLTHRLKQPHAGFIQSEVERHLPRDLARIVAGLCGPDALTVGLAATVLEHHLFHMLQRSCELAGIRHPRIGLQLHEGFVHLVNGNMDEANAAFGKACECPEAGLHFRDALEIWSPDTHASDFGRPQLELLAGIVGLDLEALGRHGDSKSVVAGGDATLEWPDAPRSGVDRLLLRPGQLPGQRQDSDDEAAQDDVGDRKQPLPREGKGEGRPVRLTTLLDVPGSDDEAADDSPRVTLHTLPSAAGPARWNEADWRRYLEGLEGFPADRIDWAVGLAIFKQQALSDADIQKVLKEDNGRGIAHLWPDAPQPG